MHLLRYTRAITSMPIIPEFQAGSWHGWHYVTGTVGPRHYRLAGVGALLAGIVGWNWYMLVNRDNWYMSPINESGYLRPELAEVFRWLVEVYDAIDPPTLKKLTPVSVTLVPLDRSSEIGGFDDLMRRALYHADVDYECYDPGVGGQAGSLLLYSGGRWLAADAQQRLLDLVEAGRHLVLFDKLPVLDDRLNPLNTLGLQEPDGVLLGAVALDLDGEPVACEGGTFFTYSTVPGVPIYAERQREAGYFAEEQRTHFHRQVGQRIISGYQIKRGQGTITVLGVPPSPDLIHALLRRFDLPPDCHTDAPLVTTALFQRGTDIYLMAVNNGDLAVHTTVSLRAGLIDETYRAHDLLSGAIVAPLNAVTIALHVPAKGGTILHIHPKDSGQPG